MEYLARRWPGKLEPGPLEKPDLTMSTTATTLLKHLAMHAMAPRVREQHGLMVVLEFPSVAGATGYLNAVERVREVFTMRRPTRTITVSTIGKAQLPQLLVALGIPRRDAYRATSRIADLRKTTMRVRGFWDRPLDELMTLKERARTLYIKRMTRAHPDKGGDAGECTDLTMIWKRICHLYRQHGLE
jgi:hypothetical protein